MQILSDPTPFIPDRVKQRKAPVRIEAQPAKLELPAGAAPLAAAQAPAPAIPARPRGLRPLIPGIVVMCLVAGAAAGAVFAARAAGASMHALRISFASADGLVSGSDVLEAGARVGYISSITPSQHNTALVTVMVGDDHWPLHSGLSARIRPKSLLGEKYVDLHDGAQTAAAYQANAVLRAGPAADPVELDQFINSLDTPTRTAVRVLLDDLGAGVAGRGQDLNAAIAAGRSDLDSLAITGATLNNRDPDLDRVLVGLDGVLSKVTSSDQLTHISQLIDSGQSVLNDIEAVQPQFSRQFTDASAALADLNVAFDGAVPSLQSTIDIAPLLLANLRTESAQLAALGSTVTTAENKNPAICAYDPSNPGAAGNAHSFVDAYIPRSITPCSPLWTLIAGLVPGPTTSGGALENTGSTQNPIFRICLSLPSSPPSSCQNSGASQQTAFGGSAGTSDAAFFAAFVGA